MRKICFVTGTRAEYGIMSDLMKKVKEDKNLQLQIIATNMHLSPEFGLTYKEITKDGLKIDRKVEMLLSSDTDLGTVKSMGVELIGIADAYADLDPDLIVILGDRYEMLAAAAAALIMKKPIAHLFGGEITEGAYDDSIRHAITKLSHLHFTSTEEYRHHIIQMGENPDRVFYVGALSANGIKDAEFLVKAELEDSIGFSLGDKAMLVTFHPVTLESGTAEKQISELLSALAEYPDYKILFTYPNSDGGGRIIRQSIDEFVSRHSNSYAVANLGQLRYRSVLRYVDITVGNSSSGLTEVPCFGIPTLNIGNRQKGRTQGSTIVNCLPTYESIREGLDKVLSPDFRKLCESKDNPYYKPNTLDSIFTHLKNYPLEGLISKHFYNIDF